MQLLLPLLRKEDGAGAGPGGTGSLRGILKLTGRNLIVLTQLGSA